MNKSFGKIHHFMGIELNQQTWSLLENENRNKQDNSRMIAFANASLYHWKKSPGFTPINEQRGEWMISHVYAILNNGEQSLTHAEKCWTLTRQLNLTGFDLAYAHEALARSYATLGDSEKMNHYFLKAKSAGNGIENKKDRELFLSDLHKGPWFECMKTVGK
tara:strand:+ start:3015 stop:3500 length:486 start_codon:yes stop_codon:yes gene_type:complete